MFIVIGERLELPAHLPEHIETRVTTWVAPSSRKKEDQKSLDDLSSSFDGLDIFLMNVEALAHQPAVQFLEKYLLGTMSLMAIDESTTIKSPTAKRTKNILKVCKRAHYRRIFNRISCHEKSFGFIFSMSIFR